MFKPVALAAPALAVRCPTLKSWRERRRIAATCAVAVIAVAVVGFTESHWRLVPSMRTAMFMVGMTCSLIACLGRIWCSLYIGGQKSRRLVDAGPYSCCRNPLYLFSAIGTAGVTSGTESLFIVGITCLVFGLYYRNIIRDEEQRLHVLHGDVYVRYCLTVPRYLPNFRNFSTPATYEFAARNVQRAMADAFFFPLITAGFHAYRELQPDMQLLPALFTIY